MGGRSAFENTGGGITLKIQLFIAAVSIATALTAGPAYSPSGPQKNVAFGTVTGGGWTQCHASDYGAAMTVASVFSGCTGDLIMLAGVENGSANIALLAWATATDVFTVTAINTTHVANGSQWYFNINSMGFAPVGFAISQNTADTNSAPGFGTVGDDGTQRLSWHTSGAGPGGAPVNLTGGWRVGNATFLNSEPSGYTRYVFTANSGPGAVPEPATAAVLGTGLAAMAFLFRKRRS